MNGYMTPIDTQTSFHGILPEISKRTLQDTLSSLLQ